MSFEEPPEPKSDPEDYSYFPPPSFKGPRIRDEQSVNVFLLTFLAAITATTVPFHTRWYAERNNMLFKKRVKYNARTDGHLRKADDQIFSLIEVKPHARDDHSVRIRMQESAQMAAFISQYNVKSHDPEKDCR